jgi:hypothetical protein
MSAEIDNLSLPIKEWSDTNPKYWFNFVMFVKNKNKHEVWLTQTQHQRYLLIVEELKHYNATVLINPISEQFGSIRYDKLMFADPKYKTMFLLKFSQ